MRLAFVTPLDNRRTGVADYSLDLLPHLARATDTEVIVFHSPADRPESISGDGLRCVPIARLPQIARKMDLIIYQMGNSPAHDFMAPFLHRYPGLVVLHDLSLHNFYARQALEVNRQGVYMRAFGFGYGLEGTSMARRYLQQPTRIGYPDYLLSEWLAARSPGTIVHSQHAATLLSECCPTARIWALPMPVPLPDSLEVSEARERLSLETDLYLIVVFGVINQSKKPVAILEALAHLRAEQIPGHVVFIGRENTSFHLTPEIERLHLRSCVTQLGFVDDLAEVHQWLAAANVGVSLRTPYWGETSASALRVLASGTPLIVNNIGAFAELPDPACVKIRPDTSDIAEVLGSTLKTLYQRAERRQAMGRTARKHIEQNHDPGQVAKRYVDIAEPILE